MFAMVHGGWPRPITAVSDDVLDALVAEGVRAQVDAGLELVTDGLVRWADPAGALAAALERGDTGADGMLVRAWQATAGAAAEAVSGGEAASGGESASGGEATARSVVPAATVTGPYSLALRTGDVGRAGSLAGLLGQELATLAAAGCSLVIVDEPAAVGIGADPVARRAFHDAQVAMLAAAPDLHAMLAITGGSAWEAGAATILAAPYRSYLFDLVAGPDNWYLVRAVPGDRGVVCAALKAPTREDQSSLLVWAARYAASSNGRGVERVGLANASSLADLHVDDALGAIAALARAARLAAMEPGDAIAAGLDRRTFAQPPRRGARRGGVPRA